MLDSGWAFLRRAGTLILASMVVVWALLYFPRLQGPDGQLVDVQVAHLQAELDALKEASEKDQDQIEAKETELNELTARWKQQSWLGRMGRAIEPAVRPLGWDWKIGMAALASFPAREVVIGTLGIIYSEGEQDTDSIREAENIGDTPLARRLKDARWDDDPTRPVFTIPTVLSLLVFFALCCQCASTLAVIRRETRSWRWPIFTFTYMTVLAYAGALLVYQVGCLLGG
jgi:ferrous iron transport protein B